MTLGRVLAVLPALLLAGCDVTLPWSSGDEGAGVDLATGSIEFTADYDGALPFAREVPVQVRHPEAASVVVGYPSGTPAPDWMTVTMVSNGSNLSVRVAITGTHLEPGTRDATVRVLIARADQSPIAYRDLQVRYVLAPTMLVSPSALPFTFAVGGTTQAQPLEIGGSPGVAWTATASQPWVTLGSASGTTPASLSVGVDAAALAVGSYEAEITVAGAGRTATVSVTLEVRQPALVVSETSLGFSGVNGAPLGTRSFDVFMDNGAEVAWTAVPGAGWIVLDQSSGTTPARITVAVDPSVGPLASGTHTAPLDLAATWAGIDLHSTVVVAAALTRPVLSVPATLLLGGADGRDLGAKPLQVSLATGGNAHAWSASASDGWMSLPIASGMVSSTPVTLDVVPVANGLAAGTRTGSITFSATVNGDTVEAAVPVTFNLERRALRVSQQGVALTSTPSMSRLTRTLRVTDSFGQGEPWSAASDAAWLSVTASGTTAGDLVLTADPAGLAADTLHLANVTIASTDPSIESAETVRVGLWVGSTAPSAAITVTGAFTEIVADPVRPYAYAHSGGSAVSIYNVLTGASVGTISAVGGSLAGMSVSGDGSKLYVVDKATLKLVPVDLDTRAVGAAWSLASTSNTYPRVSWTRTDGKPVLVVTDGTLRDAEGGTVLGTFSTYTGSPPRVSTALDGNAFCAPYCRSLSYSSLGGGTITSVALKGILDSRDGALSHDGSIVYVPHMADYNWLGYSTATGQQVAQLQWGKAYPGNVEVGWDGRIYAGRYAASSEPDVYIFDAGGAEVGSLKVGSTDWLRDGQLVLSGDGLRLLAVLGTTSGPLRFVTLP